MTAVAVVALIAVAALWHWLGWFAIPAAAVVLYAVHRLDVAYRPDGRCWWCKGKGTRPFSTREKSGPCFFCKGKAPRRRGARKERK